MQAIGHAVYLWPAIVDAAVLSSAWSTPVEYAAQPWPNTGNVGNSPLANLQFAAAPPQPWIQNGQAVGAIQGNSNSELANAQVSMSQTWMQNNQLPSTPMPAPPEGATLPGQFGGAQAPAPQEMTAQTGQGVPTLQNVASLAAPMAAPAAAPIGSGTEDCKCADDVPGTCHISKVKVRQDHTSNAGLSMADVTGLYGGSAINELQRRMVTLAHVATTSFTCLDDRLTEPSLVTPGGDLGEFVLGLASYVQERSAAKESHLSQEAVDTILLKYVEALPTSRPFVHCTDERAITHLEAQLPVENLNLQSPPEVQQLLLLKRLMEVENHGDNHIRLMLKKPEWFQLGDTLLPMVLKSFYRLLWQQHQDPSSPLYQAPKLKLQILAGVSNPQAFFEVTSADLCHGQGVAPLLIPRQNGRSVLISHLDAVSLRRAELAAFFARIANATPQKVDQEKLHQRLDRHGWQALETTGSRVAAGLPFYTLSYT